MNKTSRLFFASISIFLLMLFLRIPVAAQTEELLLDTSNHYLGACAKTDSSTFTLAKDLSLTTFQVWYYWQSGEGPLSFVLKKDGVDFLTGSLTRSSCDPYQTSWCNGDLKVNRIFPKGTYSLKVANRNQCADPTGNGVVRLYGEKAGAVNETTPSSQNLTADECPACDTCTASETDAGEDKASNVPVVAGAAGGGLVIGFVLSYVLLRKK